MLTDGELRDRCCWRKCRTESDIIYLGIGLCNDHWERACSVYLPTKDYVQKRVIPQAAKRMVAKEQC